MLDGADLAVSATTSPHFTLTAEQVAAMRQPPRLLLDLAMPRDIEQAAGEDARVTLLNLDDLGDLGDPTPRRARSRSASLGGGAGVLRLVWLPAGAARDRGDQGHGARPPAF